MYIENLKRLNKNCKNEIKSPNELKCVLFIFSPPLLHAFYSIASLNHPPYTTTFKKGLEKQVFTKGQL